jgi:hypothetical protein
VCVCVFGVNDMNEYRGRLANTKGVEACTDALMNMSMRECV